MNEEYYAMQIERERPGMGKGQLPNTEVAFYLKIPGKYKGNFRSFRISAILKFSRTRRGVIN